MKTEFSTEQVVPENVERMTALQIGLSEGRELRVLASLVRGCCVEHEKHPITVQIVGRDGEVIEGAVMDRHEASALRSALTFALLVSRQ